MNSEYKRNESLTFSLQPLIYKIDKAMYDQIISDLKKRGDIQEV